MKKSLFQFHDDFRSSETVNSNSQIMLLFNGENTLESGMFYISFTYNPMIVFIETMLYS